MSYPRHYPTGAGDGKPDENDYNAIVDAVEDFSLEGNFVSWYTYLLTTATVNEHVYYYARNAYQIVYGGPNDKGEVDGESFDAVFAAVVAACSDGDFIAVAPGTYKHTAALALSKKLTLRGAGYLGTVFEMQSDGDAENCIEITDTCTVEGIKVDGNGYGQTGIYCTASGTQLRHFEITDVDVDGLYIEVLGAKVMGYRINNCARYGIQIPSGSTDIEFTDGLIHTCLAGLYLLGGGGTKFTMLHEWGCTNGARIGDDSDTASRLYFALCSFNDNLEHGVLFQGTTGGGYDIGFTNCEFAENGDSAAGTYDAIHVNSGAAFSRVVICGCKFYGQRGTTQYTRYAISSDGKEGYYAIVGNNIYPTSFTGTPPLIDGLNPLTTNGVIADNVGECWENWGDELFPSGESDYYFDHGLVSTPKTIQWAWGEPPHGMTFYVTRTATQMHFYLINNSDGSTATAAEDFIVYWYARYSP